MDNPGEILRLCRLCLVKDQVNIPIFEEQGDIKQTFLKIRSCLPVKVSRDDKLPKKICGGCSNKLDLFYEFWSSTANSEKTLQSWLGQEEEDDKMQEITKPVEALVKEESEALEDGHAHDQSFDEATKDEAEAPPAKRARRTAAVKAQINISHDSDEDEDVDGAEPITKIEDESDESDGEEKDPSYTEVPGTSADDQAGPSGLGKDGVEAPFEMLLIDVERPSPKSYKCLVCLSTFPSRPSLINHIQIHKELTKRGSHHCPTCPKSFFNLEDLKIHQDLTHERRHQCLECTATFTHQQSLEAHMKEVHLFQFDYFCEICQQGFSLFADFRFHRQTMHEPAKPCKICGKKFSSSRSLRLHMDQHAEGKRRGETKECPICKDPVKTLKNHIFLCHSDVKLFTCETCGKSFKQKSTLDIHLRVHKDIRPHMCEFCGRGFLTNQLMVAHRRIHTGEKPYKCEICGVGFRVRSGLVNHHRIHSGERPYVCEHCGNTFARRKYLVSHYRHIHQKN